MCAKHRQTNGRTDTQTTEWQQYETTSRIYAMRVFIAILVSHCDIQPWARAAHIYCSAKVNSTFHPPWEVK